MRERVAEADDEARGLRFAFFEEHNEIALDDLDVVAEACVGDAASDLRAELGACVHGHDAVAESRQGDRLGAGARPEIERERAARRRRSGVSDAAKPAELRFDAGVEVAEHPLVKVCQELFVVRDYGCHDFSSPYPAVVASMSDGNRRAHGSCSTPTALTRNDTRW